MLCPKSLLLRVEQPLIVDADCATDKRAGAPVGVGIGDVPVAVDACDGHERTIVRTGASEQGGGVKGARDT